MGTPSFTRLVHSNMAQPSAFGFRNCKPLGRDEKKAMNDKESIEKQRLRERREEYFHFEEPNARKAGGVSAAGVGTVGWIPEAARFNTDSAHSEKMAQAERRQEEERFWDARREANVHREEKRWEQMEQAEEHQMAIDESMKEARSRKNAGSIPYDLLTLRYHDTDDGNKLLETDAHARERQHGRMCQMYDNSNKSGYNPVTGETNPYGKLGRDPYQ